MSLWCEIPVANTRLSLDPSGRVVVSLKRPLRDGRTELAFTPLDSCVC